VTLSARPDSAPLRLGYRPALDGIRGLAIACVVLFHTVRFPGAGFLGVDLFFVLSGFLITTLLLEERAQYGKVSLRDFYRRRALRLLPALLVLLGVFLVFSILAAAAESRSPHQAIFGVVAGLGYFSNVAMAAGASGLTMPPELGHLWSLAAEEQFYIVWPAVLFLAIRGRVRLALIVVGAAIALTAVEQLRLYFAGANWPRMGFGVDTRSSSILVGCLLALVLATSVRPTIEAGARRLGPLVLVALLGLMIVDPQKRLFTGPLLLFAVVSAVLIVQALDSRSALAKGLSSRPTVFLGRISYSLYLWHVPIFVVLGLSSRRVELMDIPALALALGCAIASYYFVELPFLRRKRHPRRSADTTGHPSRSVVSTPDAVAA
jgi:peptidoglycan/LPS O-acetylase OafA/YrhL